MAENNAEPGDETAVDELERPEGEIETPPIVAEGDDAPPVAESEAETGEKRTPWFQKRINELTAARRASDAAKDQLTRENEALRAMVAPKPEGGAPAAETPKPVTPAPQDFDAAVAVAAAAQRKAEDFARASNDVFNKGMAAFPGKFQGAIANLQAAGVVSEENTAVVEAALATEAPEHVLYELGNKPEEAMRLAALPPTQLAIALDRMARDLKSPAVRVSETPAPITPIGAARVAKQFDPADVKATDTATWIRERDKQVAARKAAR